MKKHPFTFLLLIILICLWFYSLALFDRPGNLVLVICIFLIYELLIALLIRKVYFPNQKHSVFYSTVGLILLWYIVYQTVFFPIYYLLLSLVIASAIYLLIRKHFTKRKIVFRLVFFLFTFSFICCIFAYPKHQPSLRRGYDPPIHVGIDTSLTSYDSTNSTELSQMWLSVTNNFDGNMLVIKSKVKNISLVDATFTTSDSCHNGFFYEYSENFFEFYQEISDYEYKEGCTLGERSLILHSHKTIKDVTHEFVKLEKQTEDVYIIVYFDDKSLKLQFDKE